MLKLKVTAQPIVTKLICTSILLCAYKEFVQDYLSSVLGRCENMSCCGCGLNCM
jgi:hypothetical protein